MLLTAQWSGIRKCEVVDQLAQVGAHVAWNVPLAHMSHDGSPSASWLVCKPAKEGMIDSGFEARPRIGFHDLLSQSCGKVFQSKAEHIQAHSGEEQRDLRPHVLGHTRGCVERNGLPRCLCLLLRNVVCPKKLAHSVRSINLKALRLARVL